MVELEEFTPGKFRVKRSELRPARSSLPCPQIISDSMPATEQVDGRFYESKRAFRAVGRSLGLVEVGNEKLKPRTPPHSTREAKAGRIQSIKKAIDRYKAGDRPRKA
jgi:hypothetical protein